MEDSERRLAQVVRPAAMRSDRGEVRRLDSDALQRVEWGKLDVTLAFTVTTRMTFRYNPVDETHWCEEPASHGCIVKSVVHELAHSCGWTHGENPSVPGDDTSKDVCECARGLIDPLLCK